MRMENQKMRMEERNDYEYIFSLVRSSNSWMGFESLHSLIQTMIQTLELECTSSSLSFSSSFSSSLLSCSESS